LSIQQINHINFSQKEIKDLFSESISGDSAAFSKLSGIVRQIAYSYFLSKHRQGKIQNTDDVDDLANNVYLSFAEQYHKIDNLEFWLRRVLFLSFVSWYKKNKSKRTIDIEEAYYLKASGSEPGVNIDAQKIISLLDNLSEDKQKIIKMRFYEDMKFSEIAETLEKSEDAVKKMFYRTIEELKTLITIVTFFLLNKL
jgi:RNA polymerase sigma-70 factor, ECF subfamily